MLKKIFISLCFCLFCFTINGEAQKVYSVTRYKKLYKAIDLIYLELGVSPLSSSYPFTEQEIENALSVLDIGKLSSNGMELYNYILSNLKRNPKKRGFTGHFAAEANVETYIQTDKDNDEWVYDYNSRKPLLELDLGFSINNHFWVDVAVPLQKGRNFYNYSTEPQDNFSTFSSGAESNLSIIWDQSQLDAQFPYLAVSSLGGKNWSILFGRDTLNYGVGTTGSFVLSEHGGYHDMLKASTFWNKFKYTFTLVDIDPMDLAGLDPYKEYVMEDHDDNEATDEILVEKSRKKLKVLINHTLEFKPTNNLSLGLHEATIRGGGEFYLGYLNPFMIIHNLALPDRRDTVLGNSLFVFSGKFTPIKRLNIYGEYALDQFETASEAERQGDDAGKGDPNAFGFLLGLNYLHNFRSFYINFNTEYVYTNPHLYRSQNSWSVYALTKWYHSVYDDNNDKVVEPLGYKEGPDTQLIKVAFDTKLLNSKLDLTLEYYNILKGENRVYHRAEEGKEAADKETPSGDVLFTKNIVSLMGSYTLNNHISIYGQLHGLFFKNVENKDGEDITDFQIILGASYKF